MFLFLTLILTEVLSEQIGQKTLVLVDDVYSKNSYSSFFNLLKSKKFQLDIQNADSKDLSLKKYGDFAYDNLIIFGSSVYEFGGSVNLDEILAFLESGRNVFVLFNSQTQQLMRMLGYECGLEIDEENSIIVDNFNPLREFDNEKNSVFTVDSKNLLDCDPIGKINGPLLFKGIGMVVDPNNDLTIKILHASSTSYPSSDEKAITKYPIGLGKALSLISAIQTRKTNGRALFVGSTDMFSDLFMNFNESFGNKQLASNMIDWTFQRRGVLRIKSINHSLADSGSTPDQYTINEVMLYKVEMEEFRGGKWIPFVAKDLQVELKRIDTFVRVFMNTTGNGVYTAHIRLPDVHGVFKIIFDYNRVGYSSIEHISQITIRPLRHDQYERYIVQAYPFYAVVFTMLAALFIFSLFWLRAHAEQCTTLYDKVKAD